MPNPDTESRWTLWRYVWRKEKVTREWTLGNPPSVDPRDEEDGFELQVHEVIPADSLNVLSVEEARLLVKANEQSHPDNSEELADFLHLMDRLKTYGKGEEQ